MRVFLTCSSRTAARSRQYGSLVALAILRGAVLAAVLRAHPAAAQAASSSTLQLNTGKQIYDAGCVSCHGPDGSGQSRSLAGFEPPATFPDFTNCLTSTAEPDVQWRAIITHGGPARGFSRIMPSFGDLLSKEQIGRVIEYVRSFCREDAWPRGNLNLPRPLVTEKAFPESETVVSGSITAQGVPGIGSTVIYEKRIGATAMMEASVPFEFTHEAGNWASAFGDLALGYKQKVFHSLRTGSIVGVGGELIVPTGDTTLGTGGESTVVEGFAVYGQILPGNSFLQIQAGVELPAHSDKVPRAYYFRSAIGKTLATRGGLGRRWSPMIEFIGDHEIARGAKTNWDVVPEIQLPINRRMHLLGNLGVRIPATNTAGRQTQILFYALWDWMDGGLLQGW